MASRKGVGESILKETKTFPASSAHCEHSVEGPASLQLAKKKTLTTIEKNISHEVVKGKSKVAEVSTTSFRSCPTSQSIIIHRIRAISSRYLNALKNALFD